MIWWRRGFRRRGFSALVWVFGFWVAQFVGSGAAFGFLVMRLAGFSAGLWASAADTFRLASKYFGGAAGGNSGVLTAAQQDAAPDRLSPALCFARSSLRAASGFRRRLSLVVLSRRAARRSRRGKFDKIEVEEITMLTSIEGTYRNGCVVLTEPPAEVRDETPVIVTFMGSSDIDLRTQGINQTQAAELRSSLSAFSDWDEPEMDAYNDYDNAKASL